MVDAEAGGAAGMVQEMGLDPDTVVEDEGLARVKAMVLETGGQLAQADGKERRREEAVSGSMALRLRDCRNRCGSRVPCRAGRA